MRREKSLKLIFYVSLRSRRHRLRYAGRQEGNCVALGRVFGVRVISLLPAVLERSVERAGRGGADTTAPGRDFGELQGREKTAAARF